MERVARLLAAGVLAAGIIGCQPEGSEAPDAAGGSEQAEAGRPAAGDTTAERIRMLEARVDSLSVLVNAALASDGVRASGGDAARGAERGAAAGPRERPEELDWAMYRNAGAGFSIEYPENVLHADEEMEAGSGRVYRSRDGRAMLAVFGLPADSEAALERLYEKEMAELSEEDRRVTYQTKRPNWFVISGVQGERVVYERAHLRDGVLKVFMMVYDIDEKAYFDPVVTRISRSFEG